MKFLIAALAATFLFTGFAQANEADDARRLLANAETTVERLLGPDGNDILRSSLGDAKGVMVFPTIYKAGFIVGGSGGGGVMTVRGDDGAWSQPAFYRLASLSVGFQAGGEASEAVFIIRTMRGVRALMDKKFTFGADAGVSVATIGAGAEGALGADVDADIFAFSNSDGLFAGAALEGTVLSANEARNAAWYGPGATPDAILFEDRFANPGNAGLIGALSESGY